MSRYIQKQGCKNIYTPADKPFKIIVCGRPTPKGRPRLGVKGGKAFVYTPAATKEYEEMVGWAAKSSGCSPKDGPIAVSISVYVKGRLDADNIAKSILDGLNGVAYEDDDQVVELLVRKHKVKDNADERVEIEVMEVTT